MQVLYGEGLAIRTGPEFMRSGPRGSMRSVDRGVRRPAIERRKPTSGCRCSPSFRRQHGVRRERETLADPASS